MVYGFILEFIEHALVHFKYSNRCNLNRSIRILFVLIKLIWKINDCSRSKKKHDFSRFVQSLFCFISTNFYFLYEIIHNPINVSIDENILSSKKKMTSITKTQHFMTNVTRWFYAIVVRFIRVTRECSRIR